MPAYSQLIFSLTELSAWLISQDEAILNLTFPYVVYFSPYCPNTWSCLNHLSSLSLYPMNDSVAHIFISQFYQEHWMRRGLSMWWKVHGVYCISKPWMFGYIFMRDLDQDSVVLAAVQRKNLQTLRIEEVLRDCGQSRAVMDLHNSWCLLF